ncbi:hypothetical protein S7335_1071 [Synechococcus sp. PCC 7335]|uniref:hypothetical protein n=1 Tax=Synechococcus sp. (strain ATCC 29403 / PCC 7335) TaxID=91464 RepID=UPI00017ECB81|nr:hypothetical protein [Synechococcus sp. PCC 7335]EDX82768.1 hypothetical protein S7335_1071 [Synechococcus sp. PCC 7335]
MQLTLEKVAIALSAAALMFAPTAAKAACTRGPNVVVNRGHGASITFNEPVYQAQVFDVSRLILEPIPEQGTHALILTEVDAQAFPGMPHTATTSLLASTASGCFVFDVSFGTQPVHNTVSALPSVNPNLSQTAQLPGGADINIEALRAEHAAAIEQHGEDNAFLQRVGVFLTLVDEGTSQRLAAQQAEVEWNHLMQLSGQPVLDGLLIDSVGA